MNRLWILMLLVGVGTVLAMRKQGVAVKGRLLCGAAVQANSTKVRIVDIDTGPDPDDTLDEGYVDSEGRFKLTGFTRELTDIDPVVYVWHDCNDQATPCQRKFKLTVPKKYIISNDPTEKDWVDIGTINLQSTFHDEKRECIS
ncbi:Transthyretin-like protein 46 [Aphelenchoides bicaudatus]|nr:Transthyretin-like protein 46 [Aphelenchoides bicaudatus]